MTLSVLKYLKGFHYIKFNIINEVNMMMVLSVNFCLFPSAFGVILEVSFT